MKENTVENKEVEAIQKIAAKYTGKAKREAYNAQARRVSRRLLLAIRAEKLTVCCPISGIVSLMEIPSIPGFTLEYEHPLSSLDNCRGIAQRGSEYLGKLDSQTLAGILIVLAGAYDLFKFQLTDTGAQKNALLRTAGKDRLIDAILLVENNIHSRNIRYLPKLSLTQDTVIDKNVGVDTRLHNYLQLLAESIAKPDTEEYDENAPPKKIGRPIYIRDVEKAVSKVSYLARQEISAAKKELSSDAKTAKTLASNLVSLGYSKAGMKSFMAQLMSDNGMGLVEADPSLIDMLINQKLVPIVQQHNSEDAQMLINILKKDRSILRKETAEEEFLDDAKPGQEAAIAPMTQEEYDAEPTQGIDSEDMGQEEEQEAAEEKQEEPQPPEGLSTIERILWKKKYQEAQKKRNIAQSQYDVGTTYVPSAEKQKLGKE